MALPELDRFDHDEDLLAFLCAQRSLAPLVERLFEEHILEHIAAKLPTPDDFRKSVCYTEEVSDTLERHERTLLWRLRWDANYESWARVNGRKLRKEIAEAMAASDLARSELEEMTREGDERREAVVFDLCSGKGLTAAVCAEGTACGDAVSVARVAVEVTLLNACRQVGAAHVDVVSRLGGEPLPRKLELAVLAVRANHVLHVGDTAALRARRVGRAVGDGLLVDDVA